MTLLVILFLGLSPEAPQMELRQLFPTKGECETAGEGYAREATGRARVVGKCEPWTGKPPGRLAEAPL